MSELRAEEVGVLAMGSHEERHGAALPPDTDARIASHVAQEAARRTEAKFIGILRSSYELPGIDTGRHQSLEEVLEELRAKLRDVKKTHGIKAVIIVNGHGGNNPIRECIPSLEKEIGARLIFNSTIIDLEGPHAATEELSMGAAVGITDESKLTQHTDFTHYPEVGFVGLHEARRLYKWAEQHAIEVERAGVRVDRALGEKLLARAITNVVNDVRKLC